MWTQTKVTQKLNIRLPIIQGPFGGGPSSVDLAAAVSNAGGLGSFGAYSYAPEQIEQLIAELRARTDRPFAINLWVPYTAPGEHPISQSEYERTIAVLAPYYAEANAAPPSFESLHRSQNFDAQVEALLRARRAAGIQLCVRHTGSGGARCMSSARHRNHRRRDEFG